MRIAVVLTLPFILLYFGVFLQVDDTLKQQPGTNVEDPAEALNPHLG